MYSNKEWQHLHSTLNAQKAQLSHKFLGHLQNNNAITLYTNMQFSQIGAIEGAYKQTTGYLKSFSEQVNLSVT